MKALHPVTLTGFPFMKLKLKSFCILHSAFCIFLTGCTFDRYSSPHGGQFTRLAIGNTTSISSLEVTPQTNSAPKLVLKGYQNDQAQTAGAITEAAIKAALGK